MLCVRVCVRVKKKEEKNEDKKKVEEALEAAKKSLWYTLGGLAIVLIGKGFISLIGSILGL